MKRLSQDHTHQYVENDELEAARGRNVPFKRSILSTAKMRKALPKRERLFQMLERYLTFY